MLFGSALSATIGALGIVRKRRGKVTVQKLGLVQLLIKNEAAAAARGYLLTCSLKAHISPFYILQSRQNMSLTWRVPMRWNSALAATAFVLCSVEAVSAATLPEGLYECGMQSGTMWMHFSNIEIRGLTFRTIEEGKNFPSHPYELTAEGVILWGGPLENIESAGTKVVSSIYQGLNGSTASLRLTIETKGAFEKFRHAVCTRRV